MSKCNLCDFESDSEIKLSKHIQHTHKLKKTDYLIQTKYNGIHPLCECGCNQETRYEASKLDFCRFISGHQSRLEGHWGDLKSEKRVNAIINTRKQKFQSGEYDHILNQVSKPRSEEIKQKISKGGTGVSRPKADGFGVGRLHSQQTKDKMSETAINNILKNGKVKRSNLEYKFEGILDILGYQYQHSYYIPDIKKIYDFYLPDYNIFIEIDGDFWHCNPDTKFAIPECKSQELNLINDQFKNEWAVNNGYKIIRIWENDIKNNIQQVKQILLNYCN
jgi:very-short-patch-repair endonuclease